MPNTTEIKKQLGGCPLFADLEGPALEALARACEAREHGTGDVFIEQGDASTDLFVLVEGEVEISRTSESGEERILGRVGAGNIFGEMQMLTGGIRMATVSAVEEATLLVVIKEDLDQIARDHPAILERIQRPIRERFRRDQLRVVLHGRFDDEELLDDMMSMCEWASLQRGDALQKQGEPADAVFFLLQGRLETVRTDSEGETRRLVDVLPGECIGERALIEGELRNTTVRASRPSEVARLSRESFLTLAEKHTSLYLFVIEVLGRRQSGASTSGKRGGRTVALVPLSKDVPMRIVVAQLESVLERMCDSMIVGRAQIEERFGRTTGKAADEKSVTPLGLAVWLEQLESRYELLLLQGDRIDSSWTRRCVDTADEIVLVGVAESSPRPSAVEKELWDSLDSRVRTHATLALLHPRNVPPSETRFWLEGRTVDRVLHVRRHLVPDYERLARFLTGTAYGVVFSGGAARAFAGVGAIQALAEVGVPIDAVGGVSAGAMVAALYAMHQHPDQMLYHLGKLLKSTLPDPTLPVVSVLRGRTAVNAFRKIFDGADIEDFVVPCLFVSSNMTRAEQRVSHRGPIHEHLYATNAMPPIVPPQVIDGDLHCDGALLNNGPIAEVRQLVRGGPVVAMDVTPTVEFEDNAPTPEGLSGWRVAFDRFKQQGKWSSMPNVLDILFRSQLLHHTVHMRDARHRADLLLQPDLGAFSLSDHLRYRAISEAGYEASIEPIRKWWAEQRAENQNEMKKR